MCIRDSSSGTPRSPPSSRSSRPAASEALASTTAWTRSLTQSWWSGSIAALPATRRRRVFTCAT
eukprot:13228911-Alexandrium_andersonii.AAC.1